MKKILSGLCIVLLALSARAVESSVIKNTTNGQVFGISYESGVATVTVAGVVSATTLEGALGSQASATISNVTAARITNNAGTNGVALTGFQSIAAGTAVVGTNAPASTNAMIWISFSINNRPCYLGFIPGNQ
jgi:uncharacterized membrane protein